MVLDRIENSERYESLHTGFKKAFDFIRNNDLASLEEGRYEIDGDDVFALIQCYETAPASEKQIEAHRNYIDIQYMVSGEEMIGYTGSQNLTVTVPYSSDSDIEFYSHKNTTFCYLEPGTFAVFFPEDPHMPCCRIDAEVPVKAKKLVLKIRK